MEFVKGGNLTERVEKKGPLEPAKAARLMSKVARAIEAAHQAGILHRDMKPSNVLLDQDDVPKVADFGLAKRTDRDDDLTLNSGPIGTLGFMPPEQFSRRNGELGPASDVYGLGATLYYLLCGRRPYAGESPLEIAKQIEADLLERLRALRSEIPPELEAVVLKCLEKDQARRYPTAIALAEDLDRFLTGQVPTAPQLTRWRRFRRWVIRQRVALASVGLAMAIAAGLAILWPKRTDVLPAPTPELPQDPQEFIRKELQAGRPVQLIGSIGLPKYYRWRLGGGGFGAAITGDNTCYYESIGNTLFEIVPDPEIDSYRLMLDIRHLGIKKGDQAKDDDRSYIGPYFGHAEFAAADGRPVHSLFGLTFADIHPNAALPAADPKAAAAAKAINVVRPRGVAITLDPKLDPSITQHQFAPFEFASNNGPVGPWRTFRIEVTPKRVWVGWKIGFGSFQTVLDAPRETLQQSNAFIQSQYGKDHLGSAIAIPEWSPRMPMGIWSYKASLSIRNVTISPLPLP
jgi:serine/threonine-protein kinase